jgi:hypothetical protein
MIVWDSVTLSVSAGAGSAEASAGDAAKAAEAITVTARLAQIFRIKDCLEVMLFFSLETLRGFRGSC